MHEDKQLCMAMINNRNCRHNLNDFFNSKNTFTARKTTGELQIIYNANFWKYNLTILKENYLQIQFRSLLTTCFLNLLSQKKFIKNLILLTKFLIPIE